MCQSDVGVCGYELGHGLVLCWKGLDTRKGRARTSFVSVLQVLMLLDFTCLYVLSVPVNN